MQPRNYIYIIIPLLAILLLQLSCTKTDRILTGNNAVSYSTDTLSFDTVFTSVASFTTQLKIYNNQKEKITLSSVRLEKGDKSYFHINVNGFEGNNVKSVEIAPNDSIYVFATVNVDPTSEDVPFVISDKLISTLNGTEYELPFIAYGQNAHYLKDSILQTTTWLTDKPYVLLGQYLIIDEAQTLTIPAGCRIYVNATTRIYVDGTVKAIGTKQDSIVIQGDRLDRKYFGNEGYPGEWGGFYFTSISGGNVFDHVVLKNCGNGTRFGNASVTPAAIQMNIDSQSQMTNDYALRMYNTRIENSIGHGLLCFTSTVYAENCLINTCGASALAIFQGGVYNFNHCTFANYGTNKVSHIDQPTVGILNYFPIDDVNYISGALQQTSLRNCVIWGSLETELLIDKRDTAPYELTLENCLVKVKDGIPAYVTQQNCIVNEDPQFENYQDWNYRPKAGSPLIDKGVVLSPPVTTDIDGNQRSALPDIGCYEFK